MQRRVNIMLRSMLYSTYLETMINTKLEETNNIRKLFKHENMNKKLSI